MTDENTTMDARLIDLEVRIAHMDDLIQSLNQTVYQQDLRIEQLEKVNKELIVRAKELSDLVFSDKIIDEKPPHY